MWPTEYLVHERRKELQRVAAQVRLAREASLTREAQMHPARRAGWLTVVLNAIRRPRPVEAVESATRPQTIVLGRVN